MILSTYTTIPCAQPTSATGLEEGVYVAINGSLDFIGPLEKGDYNVDYVNRLFKPIPIPPPTTACSPPPPGVFVSDGSRLVAVTPGLYEVKDDSLLPYSHTCSPVPSPPGQHNGDLLLAALIGGFVGNSLEKNMEREAVDTEEEQYQME